VTAADQALETPPDPREFLSGESGGVTGVRATSSARARDLALDARLALSGAGRKLDQAAARLRMRRVLAMCVYRPTSEQVAGMTRELRSSRHDVSLAYGALGGARADLREATVAEGLEKGKFENLNAICKAATERVAACDWVLVLDDDVELPARFLDRFLGVAEALGLQLAQPAQTLSSHAGWRVTRRRGGSLARETRFVEIGPVTAFAREAAADLIPFPELRFGWGLDSHWGALARERGWHVGVVDALPVRHEAAPVAASYPRDEAEAEAVRFLTGRPFLRREEAQETLRVHRRLPT
jgi:hypothetical protein